MASTVIAAGLNYLELLDLGSGDVYAIDWGLDEEESSGLRGKVARGLRLILKQDLAAFLFLCAAALGVLHQVLPVVAAGSVTIVLVTVGRAVRRVGCFSRRAANL